MDSLFYHLKLVFSNYTGAKRLLTAISAAEQLEKIFSDSLIKTKVNRDSRRSQLTRKVKTKGIFIITKFG